MFKILKKLSLIFGIVFVVMSGSANAEVSAETAYIFNTFSFLVHGFLVMFMALGFTCLEAGLVRSKNTAAICLKNIGLYSLAGLMFYLSGYPGDVWVVGNNNHGISWINRVNGAGKTKAEAQKIVDDLIEEGQVRWDASPEEQALHSRPVKYTLP